MPHRSNGAEYSNIKSALSSIDIDVSALGSIDVDVRVIGYVVSIQRYPFNNTGGSTPKIRLLKRPDGYEVVKRLWHNGLNPSYA
jgi:hypothetical protein